jgi:DNA modification methylase
VGFEQSDIPPTHTSDHGPIKHQASENNRKLGNNHPTVKPVSLMRYLIQLVTPAGSQVLDPFMGSGSTGMAAVELGHRFVGIDLDANYVAIADKRIQGWCAKSDANSTFDKLFD